LKIGVCVKQVPDTETKIRINESREWISDDGVKFVINPYDEYAIEEALKAKTKFGGEVVILTIGPKTSAERIRTAMAMGADRAVLVIAEDHKLDSLATAKILKNVIEKEELDIVFMGKQAVDNDHSSVGPMLSQMLGWPSGNVIAKMDFSEDGKAVIAEREVEGGKREVLELPLPAIVTATKGLNNPRYPNVLGIRKAKNKEIKELTFGDIGLSDDDLKASFKLGNFRLPPDRQEGKIIEGEPPEAAAKLVEMLRSESKVI